MSEALTMSVDILRGLGHAADTSAAPGPLDVRDDESLVEMSKRDRRAFAPIYRAHYPAIVRYLYRRTGNAHVAEDLAADTFIRAVRSIHRYEPRATPLRAWLYRIATNEAHRWARAESRRRARALREANKGEHRGPSGPSVGAEARDRAAVVLEALHSLSPDHQDVLSLCHVEGMSVEHAALVLKCRAGTVKSRLSRARDAMCRALQERRFFHD